MSQWDILSIKDEVIKKYPNAEIHNEICMATQKRQEAVANQTRESDLVIVVGDPRSNNTNKLAKVAEQTAGVKAYRIADLSELNIEWLKGKKCSRYCGSFNAYTINFRSYSFSGTI